MVAICLLFGFELMEKDRIITFEEVFWILLISLVKV